MYGGRGVKSIDFLNLCGIGTSWHFYISAAKLMKQIFIYAKKYSVLRVGEFRLGTFSINTVSLYSLNSFFGAY